MLRPRVIPCLLVHDKGLVKTVQFKDPKYVGDPINAVRIFNEKEGHPIAVVYGAVTTADDWLFLKLEDNILIIDNELYPYINLSTVLGILQKIVDFYK